MDRGNGIGDGGQGKDTGNRRRGQDTWVSKGTCDRGQEKGYREQETGDKKGHETGKRKQDTGNRRQGTGDRGQWTEDCIGGNVQKTSRQGTVYDKKLQ